MCDFATPSNTIGIGNPIFPSDDNSIVGSEPIAVGYTPIAINGKIIKRRKIKRHRMRNIKECLNEGLTKNQQNIFGDLIVKMFLHTNISKDAIIKALTNINDMSIIKNISDYIKSYDEKWAFPYLAGDDEYLKKENYDSIIERLAQYFEKYIVN